MGTKMAPTYATLILGFLEEHLYDKIAAFHELLNNIDPDIKFTIEESEHDISFLEICITYEGDSLSTDIYSTTNQRIRNDTSISIHTTQGTQNVPFHTT